MIKDPEKRKMLGIVFVLMDDYVSSLTDIELEEIKPIFYELILDVLTREDGPYPVGSEKRIKVCENNDLILEQLYEYSPDNSKQYVIELQRLNDHLRGTAKV